METFGITVMIVSVMMLAASLTAVAGPFGLPLLVIILAIGSKLWEWAK